MRDQDTPLATERRFFDALVRADQIAPE